MTVAPGRVARECRVTGVVQGVGFRPFVHRLAVRHGLAGWVRNEAAMVRIVVEGPGTAIDGFLGALTVEAPPLARLEAIKVLSRVPEDLREFAVLASADVDTSARLPLPADVATCDHCLSELLDPANRRYWYPFITCTDCGPRFTVITDLPYSRARTSMRNFPPCDVCQAEFESPCDRRFHSESNSCPACGPRLWLEDGSHSGTAGRDYASVVAAAAGMIRDGAILALRGLGGFHLAVDATNDAAVRRLRDRKHREEKPLAVMVLTMGEAARVARVDSGAVRLLESPERPVVLLPSRRRLSPEVHPGLNRVGLMLPSTPLHHLLLAAAERPLVMTSGNLSEEPLAAGLEEARDRLGGIADALLMHDRDIVTRCDDSVVLPLSRVPIVIRRARGLAPMPLRLPVASPVPLLATGPHLKNTATLVHGSSAFVTPHVGDLESWETATQFSHLVDSFRRLFHVDPAAIAHDAHPAYLSTTLAAGFGLPLIAVQHHHAHVAAVLAEHGLSARAVGLAFDGTGYGTDGAVWGAEVLVADLLTFRRAGHLRYAPLPGGDLASRAPWRAALGYDALLAPDGGRFARAFNGVPREALRLARLQIARGLNSPLASSMGRLFDAAAAVLGLRHVTGYEGQAAMELEQRARGTGELLPFPLRDIDGGFEMDPLPLLVALDERVSRGLDPARLAADFHASVASAAVLAARRAADEAGLKIVVLGGGSFQNARLVSLVTNGLRRAGLRVLTARQLPPNDGGVSFGQAAVAAARMAAGFRPPGME